MKDLGAHYTGAVTSVRRRALRRQRARPRQRAHLAAQARRARHRRQDQHARDGAGAVHRAAPVRPHPQSVESRRTAPAARAAARRRRWRRGMVPMAHATDGGGSIRIPASACGLFGLKPTRARNPMGPDAGEGWGGASVGHAVTRSVRDSAALLDATSGPDVGDPYWAPPPARPFLDEVGRDPGRLRIALTTTAVERPPGRSRVRRRPPTPRPSSARASATRSRRRGPDVDAAALGAGHARHHRRATCAPRSRRAPPRSAARWPRATWSASRGIACSTRARLHRGRVRAARSASCTASVASWRASSTRYDVILSPTMCRPPQPLGVLDMSTERSRPLPGRGARHHRLHVAVQFLRQSRHVGAAGDLGEAGCRSACSSPGASATRPRCSVWPRSSKPRAPGPAADRHFRVPSLRGRAAKLAKWRANALGRSAVQAVGRSAP